MIADKFVDLYARNAGLRDKLVAERDVVLTYALDALVADGVMGDLAFKGGTCLRRVVFGSSGRFSEDLDFSVATDLPEDDVLMRLVEVLNRHCEVGAQRHPTRTALPNLEFQRSLRGALRLRAIDTQ